jgi:hypothetical protein
MWPILDGSQIRTAHGPQVMAALRNLAITALRLSGATNIDALRITPATPAGRLPPTRSRDDLAGALRRSHSLPISTHSAPGGLPQDPGCTAESAAESQDLQK